MQSKVTIYKISEKAISTPKRFFRKRYQDYWRGVPVSREEYLHNLSAAK